jgi:hypothetical protein
MSDRKLEIRLTAVELGEVKSLVEERRIEGSYDGNRQNYYNRLERILLAVNNALAVARQAGEREGR